jgi:peptidyl-prolyl cis-trans isomerase C
MSTKDDRTDPNGRGDAADGEPDRAHPEETDSDRGTTKSEGAAAGTPVAESAAEPHAAAEPAETAAEPAGTSEGNADPDRISALERWRDGFEELLSSTRGKVSAGAALVVVIALVVGGYLWYHATHVPADVAFRLYGQDVPIGQLKNDVQTYELMYGIIPPTDGPKLAEFRGDIAKATAVSMIIDHAAADRSIKVPDGEAQDALNHYIAQAYGPGSAGQAKFVQDLAEKGTAEPNVVAEVRHQLTTGQLVTQLTASIQVSDQDLQRYFTEHQAQLAAPERRDLHNIVVADKTQADQLVTQLKAGANFEQLAQQSSMDTSTKNQGGDLGQVTAADLEPVYAHAAFSAPLNGVFGPIQTSHGWNIGKVVSIQPPVPAVFAQIKNQLRQELVQQHGADKVRAFLTSQIRSADVVYNPDYRPADPNSLPPAIAQTGRAASPAPPR